MHERMAVPLAERRLPGSFWKGMHVVALDGSTLAVQDTPANAEAFGRSSNQNGAAAYPPARFVALVEAGTRLIFAAGLGRYHDSELTLARALLPRLKPGMLCLADRLFPGYELWKEAAATGAHLLWRAKVNLPLEKIRDLPDGSWLARWPAGKGSAARGQHQQVRVIDYRLESAAGDGSGGEGRPQAYRLLTTILDHRKAGAEELAGFYPQRWEIELAFKESKSILRHGRITLRSKVPELVEQEFWGLLLAHYLVRKMMAQAASADWLDPDRLSYQASVEIIRAAQTGSPLSFSPSTPDSIL